MNEHSKTPPDQIPAIRISMSQRFDDYRALTFDTHVMADCDEQEINERLDKLRNAAERQKAISHLPTAKGILQDKKDGLKQESEKLFQLEAESGILQSRWAQAHEASGRRGEMKMGPQQKADMMRLEGQLSTSRQSLVTLQKDIAVHERLIADMEELIGKRSEEE